MLYLLSGFIFCVTAFLFGYRADKKDWNNGRCTCGGQWRSFDMDSSGARGYHCSRCKKGVWISFNVDQNYSPIWLP